MTHALMNNVTDTGKTYCDLIEWAMDVGLASGKDLIPFKVPDDELWSRRRGLGLRYDEDHETWVFDTTKYRAYPEETPIPEILMREVLDNPQTEALSAAIEHSIITGTRSPGTLVWLEVHDQSLVKRLRDLFE